MKSRYWILVLAAGIAGCDASQVPFEPRAAAPGFSEHLSLDTRTGHYRIVEIASDASAHSINDAGEVSGVLLRPGVVGGFQWSPNGGLTDLGVSTGGAIWFFGNNNRSEVVGTRWSADGAVPRLTAFVWTAEGGVRDLDPLPGHESSRGSAIDDAGVAVGRSHADVSDGTILAVRWAADGSAQSLGTLGGAYSAAFGVNGVGQIVGEASLPTGEIDAFVWSEATGMQGLGLQGIGVARALDINDQGEIVGMIFTPSARRAFYWDADNGFVDLHDLGGFSQLESAANAINDAGEVAIVAWTGSQREAYVWSRMHGFRALPSLAPANVNGINNSGMLAGRSAGAAVIWIPKTLGELIDGLGDLAADLADTIPGVNGLRAKVRSIQAHIAAGRPNAARNQLAALVSHVEEMARDGRLTSEEAAALLVAAQALLESV